MSWVTRGLPVNKSDELKQNLTKVRDLAKKAEAEARRFSKAERDL
jgi:hypothetical protein